MYQTFTTPLVLQLGAKKPKNYWLNNNNYRNWHYQVSNNLKQLFKETLDIIHLQPVTSPVHLKYTFYYPDKANRDIGNSLATIDKFTADALVSAGILSDDNYTIVQSITGAFGGIDKVNPRCEVTIIPITKDINETTN